MPFMDGQNHARPGNQHSGHRRRSDNWQYQGLKCTQSNEYRIKPKKSRYDYLEIDEFWTYVGKKKDKVRLIYAYHRESGEIVAFVWGKRGRKTA
jgi:hypothetical protein